MNKQDEIFRRYEKLVKVSERESVENKLSVFSDCRYNMTNKAPEMRVYYPLFLKKNKGNFHLR